jgi:hypothetical protein
MKYKCFDDIHKGIQQRIIAIHPHDYEEWVKQPVPALDGKSVLDTLNEEEGYRKIVQYLSKVEGYLQ